MKLLRHTSFNIHHIRLILACLFLPVFMVSCKKDTIEVTDLKFPLETYYIPEGGETRIDIPRGNQNYFYNVADEELIEVNISTMDWPVGIIHVKGLKKGSTPAYCQRRGDQSRGRFANTRGGSLFGHESKVPHSTHKGCGLRNRSSDYA